jgi:hypothetical protein
MGAVRNSVVSAALVLGGLAAGATGVALADSPSPTPTVSTPSGTATKAPVPGDRRGPRLGKRPDGLGGFGMLKGAGGALHGELVVPAPGGGYQTVLVQNGKVTAVSKTSITLKSEDGFSATYAVTSETVVNAARDGITTIKKGAQANVMAVRKSGKATALHVGDKSLLKELRREFKGGPGRPGLPGGAPSATASAAA